MTKWSTVGIGDKFGRLTIISKGTKRRNDRHFKCVCECGNTKETSVYSLLGGAVQSCGCLQREKTKKINLKHGLYKTRIYNIWQNMKQRCCNPNYPRFKDYGGRGIGICDEWKNDVEAFYHWSMENGYSDELTIDRIDNDGDYEPSNCRWSDNFKQNQNTRVSRVIEYNGKSKTLAEWSRILGFNYKTLQNRLDSGWSIEDAFNLPLQTNRRGKKHESISSRQ